MKNTLTLIALLLLLGASAATAQSVKTPNGDWTVTPANPSSGEQVTIKYTGDKYVKNVKVVPRIESISIKPSCLTMLEGETVNLSCKVALYKNSVLTNVTDNEKFVTWSSSDMSVLSVSEVGKVTALQEGEATVTATAANGKTDALTISVKTIPSNCVAGVFTVGECKRVCFSKGNLQYQPSTNTWRFAANQYDLLDNNTSIHTTSSYTSTSEDWIDLFGWGTWTVNGAAPWTKTTNNGDYETGVSGSGEFENVCKEGIGDGKWMTLSYEEWRYLLFTRTTAKTIRYSKATVHNVNGLVLLPDNWEGTYAFANSNTSNAAFAAISDGDWTTLEAEGAVFLPAAGYRNGTSVGDVGSNGNYWSSTAYDASGAYDVNFNSGYVDTYRSYRRGIGRSVRLVRSL